VYNKYDEETAYDAEIAYEPVNNDPEPNGYTLNIY
jgi:hypothetical protein